MRKAVIVCLVLAFVTAGDLKPEVSLDESYIIRRAYLDVLGVMPTTEEIVWYCEYNNDPYTTAVDWLVKQADEDVKIRIWLLSKPYKEAAKQPIDPKWLDRNLCYLSGVVYVDDPVYIHNVKLRFIELAKKASDSDLGAIDYMAYQLMSRVTHVDEANRLLGVLKQEGWRGVLEAILGLEDVCYK